MASARTVSEVKNLASLRRLSSNSIKMGLLMTSQENLESSATTDFKQLTSLAATLTFPTTVGSSDAVSQKNRWKDHVPYDHNRVVLTSLEDSKLMSEDRDYINASFIRGFSISGGYIATQGPMLGTVEDFWRMVWGENSRLIVMMSRTLEGYLTRSYKYWPEPGESMDVDVVVVSTEWEYEKATHVERKIVLKHDKSGETRTLHQLQFLSWPEEPDSLPCVPSFVSFWKTFRKLQTKDYGPPVVHCSNGSERTSLLVAMDIMYKQQAQAETVDVFGTVMRMREDRAHAVTSLEHYIFLHYALIEAYSSISHKKDETGSDVIDDGSNSCTSPKTPFFNNNPGSTKARSGVFFKGDSHEEEEEEEGGEEEERGIGSAIVPASFRKNSGSKRNSTGDSSGDDMLLGKNKEEIEEEFKMFTSQMLSEPASTVPSDKPPKGSFIGSALGPSNVVHHIAMGRKLSFRRCQSQIAIPVENGSVPVICIPLNHPFLRRMSSHKHTKLRHSASLQDSYVISDVSGVLPREYKKSFLATIHTRVTSPEFWQVLYDTGSCLVVRIIDGHCNEQLSEFDSIETLDFKLRVVGERELTANITQTKFTLTPHDQSSSTTEGVESSREQTIKMLTVRQMPEEDDEAIPNTVLLRLFYSMDMWLSRTNTSLVNVQCSSGMSAIGFVCAAYNAVSNLKVRDEADVYIAARMVQDRIPVALTKTQYLQLYTICDVYKKQVRCRGVRTLFSSMDSSTEESH